MANEGAFGLKHIFLTAAVGLVTVVVTGYLFDPSILAYSHFSEAGIAQTQVTQHILSDFNGAVSDFMMSFWDPIRDSLGITIEPIGEIADNVTAVASDTGAQVTPDGSGLSLSTG